MSSRFHRLTSMILVVVLLFSVVQPVSAASRMVPVDLTAAINAQKLYPQRTGCIEVDNAIERILAPYKNATTYEKVKACYDWVVKNTTYSWHGYSKKTAPAYEYFSLTYDLKYEEGLQLSVPKDMIYRSYHTLTEHKGVCYDYSILFAVMCRYIGIEAYVHTGYYTMENWSGVGGKALHHGWTQVVIGGQTYVFDLQREYRYRQNQGKNTFAFFGIPLSTAWRYSQETALNTARDKSMLPVAGHRHFQVQVDVICSSSGKGVTGTGKYQDCASVTLTSASDVPVKGWYLPDGTTVHIGNTLTFVPNSDKTLVAMFQGDIFLDVYIGHWYYQDVLDATNRSLVKGTSAIYFSPNDRMTRAMTVEFLARISNADLSACSETPFTDVPADAWYAGAVNWAYENQVVMGTSATTFSPDEWVTREDFVTMLIRYLNAQENIFPIETVDLTYTDFSTISEYALQPVSQAQALELVMGYPDDTFRPADFVNRAEGVTFLMRLIRCMESWEIRNEIFPKLNSPECSPRGSSTPEEQTPEV